MSKFEELTNSHSRQAWGLAWMVARNAADADEIVQTAFLVAWQKRDQIPDQPWPWFAATIVNCARNHRRKQARVRNMEPLEEGQTLDSGSSPAQAAALSETVERLRAAVLELGHDEREAIALYYLGGIAQGEASEIVGANLNTFKSRIKRGLDHLRDRFKVGEAAVESMLTLAFVPVPQGGWENALARWQHPPTAIGDAGIHASGYLKLFGLTSSAALIALVVWLALDGRLNADLTDRRSLGASGEQEGALAGKSDLGRVIAPSERGTPQPASPAGESSSSGTTEVAPTPRAGGLETVVPLAGGRIGTLQVRTVVYNSGPTQFQWTELITPTGAVRHGAFLNFYLSGGLKESGEYIDNLREGPWVSKHENGQLEAVRTYLHGKLDGFVRTFHDNGEKKTEGSWVGDLKEGDWRGWHPNGQPYFEDRYVNDLRQGVRVEYSESGQKRRENHWKDNQKHGEEVEFDDQGNVMKRQVYKNGKPIK